MGRLENTRKRSAARIKMLIAAACALVLLTASAAAGQQHPILVSVNAAGTGSGNARSGDFNRYRITPDGRYVLFFSQTTQEQFTERAIALESVTQIRDPFLLLAPVPFSADHRTRLSLFVWRLGLQPGEGASVLSGQAEDDQGVVHPVTVEYAGSNPV